MGLCAEVCGTMSQAPEDEVVEAGGFGDSRKLTVVKGQFQDTRWSLVMQAGGGLDESRSALEYLCGAYWYPLYAFVRRSGKSVEDAQDLTQGFFEQMLTKEGIRGVEPGRGKFRSYLLRAMKNYMTSEWRRGQALKRGGEVETFSLDTDDAESRYQNEPASQNLSPEAVYDQRWARELLVQVFAILRDEFKRAGKLESYEVLKGSLLSDPDSEEYEKMARQLEVSRGALRTQLYRMRARFGLLLREQVAETVTKPEDVDEEMSHLLAALS